MIIDNSAEIIKLLDFENEGYYQFVLMIRKKDQEEYPSPLYDKIAKEGSTEIIVKQWLIDSVEKYEQYRSIMLEYTKLVNGRLYMTLDQKSLYKSLKQIRDDVIGALDRYHEGHQVSIRELLRLTMRAASVKETSTKTKRWMFDVDTKDSRVIESLLRQIDPVNILVTLPSKNGYHIITKRNFNATSLSLPDLVEVKSNANTLVAM